jgi:hypothetical protein
MLSILLESVIVAKFQATEALDLTKAKYSTSRLFKMGEVGMLLCELALEILVHVKNGNRDEDENEVRNQYAHPNP